MNKVSDYIFVTNAISKDLCESLIDECNKKQWKKHTWNDYTTGEFSSEILLNNLDKIFTACKAFGINSNSSHLLTYLPSNFLFITPSLSKNKLSKFEVTTRIILLLLADK